MPNITVKHGDKFEVAEGKRLVLALEDSGVDILHRCGGFAACTTCRVKFEAGEPSTMTVAEKERLGKEDGLLGEIRLSCQILCEDDMILEPLMRVSTTEYEDAGKRPQDDITPDPEWTDAP